MLEGNDYRTLSKVCLFALVLVDLRREQNHTALWTTVHTYYSYNVAYVTGGMDWQAWS